MVEHGQNVRKSYSESTFKGWDGWLVGWKSICRFTHLTRKTLIPLIKNHELPVYSLPGGTVMAIPELLNVWAIFYDMKQEKAGGRRVAEGEFGENPNAEARQAQARQAEARQTGQARETKTLPAREWALKEFEKDPVVKSYSKARAKGEPTFGQYVLREWEKANE